MTNAGDADAPEAAGQPTRHHRYLLAVTLLIETANRLHSPGLVDRLALGIARLAYRRSHRKRQRMEQSLARVFGPLPDTERTRIVRGAFYTFWDETGWQT